MNKNQTADYIANILTSSFRIMGSWGVIGMKATEFRNMNGLTFMVNGFIHKGIVNIVYNAGGDYFEVFTLNENSEVKDHIRDVYFDELVDVVDRLVEKGDFTDEEYRIRVENWLN